MILGTFEDAATLRCPSKHRLLHSALVALFACFALLSRPALALDFDSVFSPDFENPRTDLTDLGCPGGEFWARAIMSVPGGGFNGRPNQGVALTFVLFEETDEQYTYFNNVWFDYTDPANPVFVDGAGYSDGRGEAFDEGGPIGIESCTSLVDITTVSVTPPFSDQATLDSLDFVGYIFDVTDTNDGFRYRYTAGYEGVEETVPVFRRIRLDLVDPEPIPVLSDGWSLVLLIGLFLLVALVGIRRS